MTGCRIGKVTPKLQVVERLPPPNENLTNELESDAAYLAKSIREDGNGCGGYALIGWNMQGEWWRLINLPENGPIPLTLAPAYIEEIVRRRVMEQEACDVFNRGRQ